jgi:hypothetical protein
MDIAVTNKSCNVLFLSQKRFLKSYVAGVVLILEYFDIICVVSKFWRFIVHNILFGFIL